MWSNEDAVLNGRTMVDRGAILDFDSTSNHYIQIDVYALANDAGLTDLGPFPNLGLVPDFGSCTHMSLRGYICGRMNQNTCR